MGQTHAILITQGGGRPYEREVTAHEHIRHHRITYACDCGYYSRRLDRREKVKAAPDPSEKRQLHPTLVDRLPD